MAPGGLVEVRVSWPGHPRYLKIKKKIKKIKKNRYSLLILLTVLLSTHIFQDPSFFGTSREGTAQGLLLSQISPLLSNSSTCLVSSSCSLGLIL